MTKYMLENCPPLDLDEILYKDRPMPAHVKLERRIVWNLFLELAKIGCTPYRVVSDESVAVKTAKAAMEEIFNLDECIVNIKSGNSGASYSVKLVLGNGYDIISDYSYYPGTRFTKLLDKFSPEEYA